MILCITPNPAIDRTLILSSLVLGKVQRADKVLVAAGGKGLNVARAIHNLGGEALCMGFAGGHSGHLLADQAQSDGLDSSWTWVNSETRACMILVSRSGDATEIDEPGTPVSKSDWKRLQRHVRKQISFAGLACLSGSLPADSSVDDLRGLLHVLVRSGKPVWVDTSGTALDAVLNFPGLCVKVNAAEISQSLGFEVRDVQSAKRALKILGERELKACLITLGSSGALLATAAGRWFARVSRVRVVSSVGSGDSFLGSLVHALDVGHSLA